VTLTSLAYAASCHNLSSAVASQHEGMILLVPWCPAGEGIGAQADQ